MSASNPDSDSNSTRDEAVYEDVQIWPVSMVLIERAGVTLWGSGGVVDGVDHLLTSARGLVLPEGPRALEAFVVDGNPNTMSLLPGYQRLVRLVGIGEVALDPYAVFDYGEILSTLARGRDTWNREVFATLLDALNLLGDVANSLNDNRMIEILTDPICVELLNRVTFMDEGEVADVRALAGNPRLTEIIKESVLCAERRIA